MKDGVDTPSLSHERDIQDRILKLANESRDPEVLLNAATILKYFVESGKQRVETRNFLRSARTEAIRFFVPIIAPLVSALAVVGALVFQTIQFRVATDIQRQT